ncbi:hypothetical protein AUR64_14360 [Haloprofundus marisrubri]|uniref:Uncharacterized protein n=1 Tax=Haloprofundus marisrubri TaxID=1514971 RepID=A0A0W1R6J7_9EURY|nr:hypothetical protein [Haloprofundus marisrubri]KTG08985.1 hypothetical protein AUR64_14360 [Haloprofundus marisrubri]
MSAFDDQPETEFCYGCQRERLNCNHSQDNNDSETELTTCETCGAVGLPERILEHDCRAFVEDVSERITDERDAVVSPEGNQ